MFVLVWIVSASQRTTEDKQPSKYSALQILVELEFGNIKYPITKFFIREKLNLSLVQIVAAIPKNRKDKNKKKKNVRSHL